jgi:hypothetical protein
VLEPQNQEVETQQEVQPASTELAMKGNKTTQNRGSEGTPDMLQVPNLGQPIEETTGTTST